MTLANRHPYAKQAPESNGEEKTLGHLIFEMHFRGLS